MKRFKNILVGVDLSWGDRLVAEELSPPNAEAVRQAMWLAKLNGASIHFLFSLDLSVRAQKLLAECTDKESTIVDEANEGLVHLIEMAKAAGVTATASVAIGKGWLNLIQHVLRNDHDLVLVGSRNTTAVEGFLLGSTGIKLLRKCPCAVWVTQPRDDEQFRSILVAHDLRPVGDLAMALGSSMAQLQNSQLHVLHAADFFEFDTVLPPDLAAVQKEKYREEAEAQIQSQLAGVKLDQPATMHFEVDSPGAAITNCVQENDIDLIVMGTVGRTGIAGFVTGNTAERLLPRLTCSLLAVKPPGFESPIKLDDA